MSVELILLDDVVNLGKIGDKVKVSDGYARNFLLPRKLAQRVTVGVLRQVEAKKLVLQKQAAERLEIAQAVAAKLSGLAVLEIPVTVGENDKMYGSVSAQVIAEMLQSQGFEIEKNAVLLDEPIRDLGSFDVEVKVHAEVKAVVKVNVSKKG